ncbi:uncharacterized protein LOC119975234 isoform X2 [Scyliorhinus canicula]|uniref:uncharacterized protein LOC119975234 isoform X2 n=1 Tax=Scyliorhinus canicula TaxID=7830 RepID=UPI0018F33DEB|nr:uncharacterized protein LOC119975234 isoform X2 [Scyliorhinus canicula]
MKILLVASILCNVHLRVFAFKCKKCLILPNPRCEDVNCESPDVCVSVLSQAAEANYTGRACEFVEHCGTSLNTGSVTQSIICCRTDFCNNHTLPELENSNQCYGCTGPECQSELKLIKCTANQQYCAWGYFKGTYRSPPSLMTLSSHNISEVSSTGRTERYPFRGCASLEACAIPFPSIHFIRCCCGDQCNRSASTQCSVSLLVSALLSTLKAVISDSIHCNKK